MFDNDNSYLPSPFEGMVNGASASESPTPTPRGPHTLEQVSDYMESLPRFKTLDSVKWTHQPMYQTVVNQYVESNPNFKSNPRLVDPGTRKHLVDLIEQVYGRSSILFAIDIEAWELNTNIVTELGIAIYDPRDQQVSLVPSTTHIHIRIKEHLDKTNGRYVPHNAKNFNGTTTYIMTESEATLFTQCLVNYYFHKIRGTGYNCYLVGHDLQGDIKWMNSIGVNFPKDHQTLDTNRLFRISHGKENISLKRALEFVDIPYAYLHNAGNDAYYSLMLALKICDPQSRVRYALDVLVALERDKPIYTKEEKLAHKEAKRQARLEARARGEEYVPDQQQQQQQKQNGPKRKKKRFGKGDMRESVELNSAVEATSIIFK